MTLCLSDSQGLRAYPPLGSSLAVVSARFLAGSNVECLQKGLRPFRYSVGPLLLAFANL